MESGFPDTPLQREMENLGVYIQDRAEAWDMSPDEWWASCKKPALMVLFLLAYEVDGIRALDAAMAAKGTAVNAAARAYSNALVVARGPGVVAPTFVQDAREARDRAIADALAACSDAIRQLFPAFPSEPTTKE